MPVICTYACITPHTSGEYKYAYLLRAIQLFAEACFGLTDLIGNDESLFKDQSRDNNCYGTARTTTS